MALPWPCAFSISAATRRPPPSSMSLTTTRAPSSAKRLAMPSPKPEPPPVTIATLPASLMMRPPSILRDSVTQAGSSPALDQDVEDLSARNRRAARRVLGELLARLLDHLGEL